MFIQDMYNYIAKFIKNCDAEINHGNGYLEVRTKSIKKQKLVDLLLEKISANCKIDYVLYMGNDSSDEVVYEFLKS